MQYIRTKFSEQEYTKALPELLHRAQEYRCSFAQGVLSTAYFFGMGTARDLDMAYKFALLGAQQNDGNATLTLGLLSLESKERDKAQYWLYNAWKKNNIVAAFYLAKWFADEPGQMGLALDWAKCAQKLNVPGSDRLITTINFAISNKTSFSRAYNMLYMYTETS